MSAEVQIIDAARMNDMETDRPTEKRPESEEVAKVRKALGDDLLFVQVADLFHILSDPTRLRLITALAKTPLCVGDLSQVVGLGQSATSHALRILRDRGIARAVREGQQVRYHLADDALRKLIRNGWRHAIGDPLPEALAEKAFTGRIEIDDSDEGKKKKKKKDKAKKASKK